MASYLHSSSPRLAGGGGSSTGSSPGHSPRTPRSLLSKLKKRLGARMSPLATTVAADAMTAEASSGGRLCGHLTLTVIGARDVPSIRDTVTGDVAVDLRANGGFHFRTPRARVVTVGRSSEAQLRWAASTAGAIQGADVLQVVVRSVPRLRPARALARCHRGGTARVSDCGVAAARGRRFPHHAQPLQLHGKGGWASLPFSRPLDCAGACSAAHRTVRAQQ